MLSENIFIDHQRWNNYSHPSSELQNIKNLTHPADIRLYFTQKNITTSLVRQISNNQLQKVEGQLKSARIRAIYKQKVKRIAKTKKDIAHRSDLDAKLSSRTNFCEQQEEQVSQYLSIWEAEQVKV